jgi:flavodoxin
MSVLVAYLSQTGNTKKVAEVIYGAITQQKEIKCIDELQRLAGYPLVFLGFPVHNFGPDEHAKNFLEKIDANQRVALFITHAAPEGGSVVQAWTQKFVDAAKNAIICGVFDCQGELSQQVKNAMLNHPSPEIRGWAQADNSQGQPDGSRLEKAKIFAENTIKKEFGGYVE